MTEHEWHTVPASGAPYIYCANCDVVFDFEDNIYYDRNAKELPGDPGCVPLSGETPT